MDILEIVKSCIKNVFSNKLRTFLTMLGIIIGIGSVIAINSIGNGSISQVEEELESFGLNRIEVSIRTRNPRNLSYKDRLTFEDYEYLRDNLQGYQFISTEESMTGGTKVRYLNTKEIGVEVLGVTQDYEKISNINILNGRFVTNEEVDRRENVIVVSDTFSKKYFGTVDSSVLGREVNVRTWKGKTKFKVVGIYENKDAEFEAMYPEEFYETLYTPVKTLFKYNANKSIDSIVLTAPTKEEVSDLSTLVVDFLHQYKGNEDKYNAQNYVSMLDASNEVSRTMTFLIGGVASISLLVAGIGIMNIMLVTITERTREIGIRKSIGAKNKDILFQFMIEAIIITLIGGIMGIITGWGLGLGLSKLLGIKSVISIGSILFSLGVSSFIGLVFGIYPARKASLLDPIDALTRV